MLKKAAKKALARPGTAQTIDTESTNVPMSIRMAPPLYEELRTLGFERRRYMNEYISRGVEMVLKAEGRGR